MSKPVVTIAANAVNAKLHEPTREAKMEVQQILSYRVNGAEETVAFKRGGWDGRSSFFTFKSGTFPAGFLHLVSAHLRKRGYDVRIVRKQLPEALGPLRPEIDAFGYVERYDYQPEVVDRLVKHGQIIAQVATGGGKSRIARMAFARIDRPTLFLTTRSILMYQMKETFEQDLGVTCSVLGDGQFGHINAAGKTCVKKMSVGMVQTLISRLEETTLQREFDALYESATKKLTTATNAKRKELMEVANMTPALLKRKMAEFVDAGNKLIERQAAAMKKKAAARLEEKEKIRLQTIGLLAMFEFVILEEAHEASGASYYEILKHCKNAHYRLAMTGTPFMKDDEESNMRLMACSGPIAIKVSEKTLIDRGILAKPYFKFVQLETRPMQLHRATGWQAAYRIGIVQNQERNRAVVREVIKAKRYGLTTMILVQQTAHGEVLRDLLTEAGLSATFIRGENNQVERKAALSKLVTGETDALIGTTILDVGVDVPAVGMIILAGGGKAEVALRQRIGRGLRAKKTGPNAAFVVDFSDQFNDYTRDHAKQRHGIIRDTEGFGENIITSTDFEYEKLGFVMVKS